MCELKSVHVYIYKLFCYFTFPLNHILEAFYITVQRAFLSSVMAVPHHLFFFLERGRGEIKGEGERESLVSSMPSMEPDVGLDFATLRS